MIRSTMNVFGLAEIIVKVVSSTVHGKATTREQFSRHDRGIGVTEVRHHICLSV